MGTRTGIYQHRQQFVCSSCPGRRPISMAACRRLQQQAVPMSADINWLLGWSANHMSV